jgi:hypothetical protein
MIIGVGDGVGDGLGLGDGLGPGLGLITKSSKGVGVGVGDGVGDGVFGQLGLLGLSMHRAILGSIGVGVGVGVGERAVHTVPMDILTQSAIRPPGRSIHRGNVAPGIVATLHCTPVLFGGGVGESGGRTLHILPIKPISWQAPRRSDGLHSGIGLPGTPTRLQLFSGAIV